MKQTRLKHLDFMRGIAILNVLIIHQGLATLGFPAFNILYRLCIPVFVFVTGLTIVYSIDRPYIENLLKKISYMVNMTFIYLVIIYLIYDKTIPLMTIFTDLLSGKVPEDKNAAMWYFPFYIGLYFVVWSEIKFVKMMYELVLKKLCGFSKVWYYILLAIVSVVIIFVGQNLNVDLDYTSVNNPFFIKNALVMQGFAVSGHIVSCISQNTDEIKNIFKNFLPKFADLGYEITKIFILIISTILFFKLAQKYGFVDVRPLIYQSVQSFYISTMCGLISLYLLSKYICDIFNNFFVVNYICYCGRRSLHICGLHLVLIIFLQKYLVYIQTIFAMTNGHALIQLIVQSVVLSLISIFISYAIEREK